MHKPISLIIDYPPCLPPTRSLKPHPPPQLRRTFTATPSEEQTIYPLCRPPRAWFVYYTNQLALPSVAVKLRRGNQHSSRSPFTHSGMRMPCVCNITCHQPQESTWFTALVKIDWQSSGGKKGGCFDRHFCQPSATSATKKRGMPRRSLPAWYFNVHDVALFLCTSGRCKFYSKIRLAQQSRIRMFHRRGPQSVYSIIL